MKNFIKAQKIINRWMSLSIGSVLERHMGEKSGNQEQYSKQYSTNHAYINTKLVKEQKDIWVNDCGNNDVTSCKGHTLRCRSINERLWILLTKAVVNFCMTHIKRLYRWDQRHCLDVPPAFNAICVFCSIISFHLSWQGLLLWLWRVEV